MIKFTSVRKLLKEVLFDPRKDIEMKVYIEVGNIDYYTTRAIEAIRNAENLGFKKSLILAIRLLLIAILVSHETDEGQ